MSDIPNEMIQNTKHYQIESPEGMVDFYGINKIYKSKYLKLKFTNGQTINCSEDHPIETIEGIVKAKYLNKKTEISTKDKFGCYLKNKCYINKPIYLYDIINSGNLHLYYSNGIVSHNCEFLGSQHTLISGEILTKMPTMKPVKENEDMAVYIDTTTKRVRNRLYIIVVDTSRGVGGDYNAFVIFDVTEIPYQVVARYRNNTISPLLFPNIIYQFAKTFNDAYICVEVNDNGQQVADIIYREMEYENMIFSQHKGRTGQSMSTGFGHKPSLGVRTTKLVKRVGCTNLKTLVENNKLFINDLILKEEFYTFIEMGDTYSASDGNHDDMVMCCVIFSWLVQQPYFKDWTDTNVRERMVSDNLKLIDDDLLPVMSDEEYPLYDTGEIKEVSYREFERFLLRD